VRPELGWVKNERQVGPHSAGMTLAAVVGFHHPSSTPGEIGRECEKLLHLFD